MSYSPDHQLPATPHLEQQQSSPPSSGPNILLTPPLPLTLSLSPSRAAPSPPTYSPRRARDRHIAMKEPAKVGLFTVDEEAGGSWKETFLALKTDLAGHNDPFGGHDADCSPMDLDIEVRTPVEPLALPTLGTSSSMSMSTRPRRLAPLDLNITTHSLPYHPSPSSLTPTPTPQGKGNAKGKRKQGLMGAAPILSPEEYSANREFDLGAVLDDLLNTCGERVVSPMPPPRSPAPAPDSPTSVISSERQSESRGTSFTTPPKSKPTTGSPPPAPGPKKQRRPQLKGPGLGIGLGDHSFLSSLSRENSPISPNPSSSSASTSTPRSSSSSSSSSKSGSGSSAGSTIKRLPPRASLPSHWTDNVI